MRHIMAAGVGALALVTSTVSGQAGLLPAAAPTAQTGDILPIQYRGRGGGGFGPGVLFGLGTGVVVGSIIANQADRPRPGYYYDTYAYNGPYYYPAEYRGDPRELCAQYFKSFEWRSGMYTTYQGERRLCPYLR